MSVIIFLLILLVLVISHEWGHFIVAKKTGCRVDEFAFGFPPKLFGIKKGETSYNFNALPIGGYVKIFGENGNGEDDPRSFVNKKFWQKIAVLFAGVFMNFIVAWILISIGFISGLPTSVDNAPAGANIVNQELVVNHVLKDSPAEMADIKAGDHILHVSTKDDFTDLPSVSALQYFIKQNPNETISLSVKSHGEVKNVEVLPKIENGNPSIGVSIGMIGEVKLPVHKAIFDGLVLTSKLTFETAKGFVHLVKDAVTMRADISSISGPVGIVGIVGDATKFGFIYILSLAAIISVNLAVINMVPFPALDGGRILFLVIEKLRGKTINKNILNIVNTIGFIALIVLMIVITYHDIVKLL